MARWSNGMVQPTNEQLLEMINGTAEELGQTYIILDALDEATDRDEMLTAVREMLSWDIKGFHLYVSSREDQDLDTTIAGKCECVTMCTDWLDEDLELYIREQMQTSAELRTWPAKLQQETQRALLTKKERTFQLVNCQLALLSGVETEDAMQEAVSGIATLPETYAALFRSMMQSEKERVMKLSFWLAVSTTPLPTAAAMEFLAIREVEHGELTSDGSHRVLDQAGLRKACSIFVDGWTVLPESANGQGTRDCELSYTSGHGRDSPGASTSNKSGEPTTQSTLVQLRLAHRTVKDYILQECLTTSTAPCRLDGIEYAETPTFSSRASVWSFIARRLLAFILTLKGRLDPMTSIERHPLAKHGSDWSYYVRQSGKDCPMDVGARVLELMKDNGNTEQYMNWCIVRRYHKSPGKSRDTEDAFRTPLYFASLHGIPWLVNELLNNGSNPNAIIQGAIPLLPAIENGDVEIVRALLEAGADPNLNRASLLKSAACVGNAEIIKLLIEHGCDTSRRTHPSSSSALNDAARRGHLEAIRVLLNAGADVNAYSDKPSDVSPLESASSRGYKDCVELLLPKASRHTLLGGVRSTVHAHGKELRPQKGLLELYAEYVPDATLNYAARLGDEALVAKLLEKGAKTETRLNRRYRENSIDGSALVEACISGHRGIAEKLITHGADVNAKSGESFSGTYPICTAVQGGHLELVRLLLQRDVDVNASGGWGPALQIAMYQGHHDIVQELLKHGADIHDSRGSYGGPVQAAVLGDHLDLLEQIVTAGADINMPAGETRIKGGGVFLCSSPIQAAVYNNKPHLVDWLIAHGANVNLQAIKHGNSDPPLATAARNGNMEIVNKLLAAGADVNQPDQREYDTGGPLYWAVREGHAAITSRLLDAGANPNASGGYYEAETTILTRGAMGNNTKVIQYLLDAGADVNQYSQYREYNEPPLHTACRYNHVDVVQVLVERGANVNEQIQTGQTPLHIAARHRHADILALLLRKQADDTLTTRRGQLPFHVAAGAGDKECTRLLLEAGADLDATDDEGRTALHFAADSQGRPVCREVIGYLLEQGADPAFKDIRGCTAQDLAEARLRTEAYSKDDREQVVFLLDSIVPGRKDNVDLLERHLQQRYPVELS